MGLGETDERLDNYPGLAQWWRHASALWATHRSSDRLSLVKQLDYRRKFTQEFPAPPLRVAYAASGMYLAAALIEDPAVIIEKSLYWGAVSGPAEGRYLLGILNSDATTLAVRRFQARGEHNPRHFDKYIFQLPIPKYDELDPVHLDLVAAATHAESVVAAIELPGTASSSGHCTVAAA